MNIVFRELQEKDFDSLFLTALEAWSFTYREIFKIDYIESFVKENYGPKRLHQLLPGIKAGRRFFEVALEESRVVGFCCAMCTQEGIEINRFYLHPKQIGHGLGTEFLRRLESYARKQGAPKCYCYVHKENELGKRFYLRKGFWHDFAQDKDDDWRMVKMLDNDRIRLFRRIRWFLRFG